jgi:hypothetical protein
MEEGSTVSLAELFARMEAVQVLNLRQAAEIDTKMSVSPENSIKPSEDGIRQTPVDDGADGLTKPPTR